MANAVDCIDKCSDRPQERLSGIFDKLRILSAAARYDVSCASSGSSRKSAPGSLGNVAASGICHSWAADGRCISLLKVLFTNYCTYDCAYCLNRRSNDVERAAFTPEELAELTISFYRRNYIEGLFLSSGVLGNPDYTMELLIRSVRLLREVHRFGGYIHLKAIPGADPALLFAAGTLVDRMSVNLELPSQSSLQLLAPDKSKEQILLPMTRIRDWHREHNPQQNRQPLLTSQKAISGPMQPCKPAAAGLNFVPGGQSTQMIIGASPEDDRHILTLSESLYKKMQLKRVYYSAYIPVNHDSRLPEPPQPPLLREHRLYQADWLLRFYRFSVDELFENGPPTLDTDFDPKIMWALRHPEVFPVDVNRADFGLLLRVPGLGMISAQRIVRARRVGKLSYDDLVKLGVVLKRARFFLVAPGSAAGDLGLDPQLLRRRLLANEPGVIKPKQLSLNGFPGFQPEIWKEAVTGQF
ncbi:MAG TPA: putative DNA modification/repair radical SAM protein [Candidatus Riflebacteria bacterium]|nr:putative DNA modification/repair radical SAM protein [Candidatus Riflebacteria bacterium]